MLHVLARSARMLTPKRRCAQFSLGSLFLFVTALCVWLGVVVNRANQQRDAVAFIEAIGGRVMYAKPDEEAFPRPFLRRWLPRDYLNEVQTVDLSDSKVTDAGLAQLQRLTGLQVLDLRSTQVTDAGLAHLAALSNLRQLDLRHTGVTADGLAHLSEMRSLERLSLYHTRLTDGGLVHLARLVNLRDLSLPAAITDDGLVHLAALKNLRVLWLTSTQTTSAGLPYLQGLTQLEKVVLADTLIDDEAIAYLEKLPNLKEVGFVRVAVSQAAIDRFMKSRPKCRVAMGYWAEDIEQCKQQVVQQGGRIETDHRLAGEPVIALDLSGKAKP